MPRWGVLAVRSILYGTFLTFFLLAPLPAAPAERAPGLEAKLKETPESSAAAAKMMLELIDLYWADEQVFGLIRTADKFCRAQATHPKRAEVMIKLMDGHAVAARHEDVITSGRQFLELFPKHALTNEARAHLATSLERTGRLTHAAGHRRAIWQNGGSVADGIHALRLFLQADNAAAFKAASELALELTGKLPADSALTGVGFQGLEAASRAEQWAQGLQIGKTLNRRKAPMDERLRKDLWFRIGQFESRLGQHENATASFKKALTPGRDDIHRSLAWAMVSAKNPPAKIEAEARRYLAAYSDRPDGLDLLAQAAEAYAEAKLTAKALSLSEEIIRQDVAIRDVPRKFVTWCGEDHRRAEQGLRQGIEANPGGAWKLRTVLTLDVYRDRLKDPAKARRMAREFLAKSPGQDERTETLIGYLLDSAPDEASFRKDLELLAASARQFPHLAGYQGRIWKTGPKDKLRNREWQRAKKTQQGDQTARLWRMIGEKGGKAGQACQQLLQKNPTKEQRRLLLARLAYVYRHHYGGNSRKKAASHYQKFCSAFPKDLEAASLWLESADYAERDEKLAAARHLLTLPPGPTHPDTWIRLVDTRDENIVRKAIPWISKSAAAGSSRLGHATRIGDMLNEIGMKDQALTWWRSHMDIDPGHHECVGCSRRVASSLPPNEARKMLKPRFAAATGHHGIYAAGLAGLALKSDDLDAMESVLKQSRARADKEPFTRWTMNEWAARSWLESARNGKDWPTEKRARLYRMVRDLRLGRVSSEAGMELLADTPRNIERLREAQRLILMAERHHESWKRLYPQAQAALARDDHTLGATILNGLLHSIRSVGEAEMKDARTLLRKAYGRMGSLTADIPADSPIAPLLQVLLHLRLGEDDLAEQAYYQHRDLFDTHRHELPVELVLFGAQTHIDQGTPEDHERAEDILRGWLIKFGESENIDLRDKARVQLLLARNYQRALQFDIARAEFTTVLNLYKDQPEAVEARFGIGETYMAQKVYDEAAEIFTALAESPSPAITIRAEFLRGVLAIRQDNNEEARRIFLAVLERSPDTDLANETLFNLAEVYGLEQRYLTQLETLRTVGRLGRESKLWHTPGTALSVLVQDSDLGISRGDTRIPVVVRTEPGNDREESFLASGGAGKGIFLTEIPTTLGEAVARDGTLQVTGGDVITVDYPEDFKKEFQFEFLSSTRLRVASDGSLEVASSRIVNEDDPSFTEELKKELAKEDEEQTKATRRPKNQVKPGNLVYAQVIDGDRDLTKAPDTVGVKMTASSGDAVQLHIEEESHHGGVFTGTVRTGELPAGAMASDSALDHSPLMAIDHAPDTSWRSAPDGAAPKSLAIDMKELRPVESVLLSAREAENEAPVRMHVRGSHDGRFHYTLGQFPTPEAAPRPQFATPEMRLRIYRTAAKNLRADYSWQQIVSLIEKEKPTEDRVVESLDWQAPEEGDGAYFLVWSGSFIQERDGGMRFGLSGLHTALMVDGRLELPVAKGEQTVDIYAKRGIHELTAFSIVTAGSKPATVLRARENPQSAAVSMRPFHAGDFDLGKADEYSRIAEPVGGVITQDENVWSLTLPAHELRFIDFEFLEYRGEAVAINHVEISGGGAKHVPPAQDVLELASNDTLELAPGDTVTVSYLDELTAGGLQRNRLLTRSLTATYHNGTITPVSYEFTRSGGGSVRSGRKELMRIEPGERIVAEVVDYDLDTGLGRDEVEVLVQVNGDEAVALTATETGPSSGIFIAEIDTSAEAADGKLVVKQGDKVYFRYQDQQNTFPGHAFYRETLVYLNEPSEAVLQIVESTRDPGEAPRLVPVEGLRPPDFVGQVAYQVPLTVEVIDPDQAKDSRSTVTVEVETSQGTRVDVECVLSRSFAAADPGMEEVRNPALYEGRFVGQIPLSLGGPDSPLEVPADETAPKGGLGKILRPADLEPGEALDDGVKQQGGILVLNVNGKDEFTARYHDTHRPDAPPADLTARAALFSPATLRITDSEYLEDAEIAHVGKKLFLWLEDPDLDISGGRDKAMVRVVTGSGEDETIELEETLSHTGIFSGSFPLKAIRSPVPGNSQGEIECFFGDLLTLGYLDNVPQTPDGEPVIEIELPVALGTNGVMAAFSKVYKDEDLAIQTQFHIAESYFELFKSHRRIERLEEAAADLQAGRRVLRELTEDYPNPKYAPRVAYLLGQFAQEMEAWNEAIAAYHRIVQNHPEHNLAPDAQYKLGQCHEEAGELDEALEAYVTLAATYPKSPLIANVMLRINEHFYQKEEFSIAASVGAKFLERFPNHEWTPKMAFRIGQCHYKEEYFTKAGLAFDAFVKRFPEEDLTAQALFWSGESYRMDKDIPNAFRRYNRCRWDFPESDAAKYSRGRLALPELLAQFEKEANLD